MKTTDELTADRLRELIPNELNEILSQTQEKLRRLRFEDSFGQLKTKRDIRKVRKNIAMIKTVLKEKSI